MKINFRILKRSIMQKYVNNKTKYDNIDSAMKKKKSKLSQNL